MVPNTFGRGIFPVKNLIQVISTCLAGTGIKIFPLKQNFQRLTIAPVQLKTDNASKDLLNEICPIIHSF